VEEAEIELKIVGIQKKRGVDKMGNPVTEKLPDWLDEMLQDLSQMEGLFGYTTIMDFGDVYTDGDVKKLRKLNDDCIEEYEVSGKLSEKTKQKIKYIIENRIKNSQHKLANWKKDLWRNKDVI